MPGLSRRKVLIGAGAIAAAAAATPILSACQPTPKTGGSGKVVVMTDPHEFNADHRKTLESATKLKMEVVKSDLTTLYATWAGCNSPDIFRVQSSWAPQYISRTMLKYFQ